MNSRYFYKFFLILLFLFFALYYTYNVKEHFINYCDDFNNCRNCSGASGCSWCPSVNKCISSALLKSTDNNCNQSNTISSPISCRLANNTEQTDSNNSNDSNDSNNILYDFNLYKNKITDKIPPPNLYTTDKVRVSPEDLLSNMNSIRNKLNNYQIEMPSIISSSVENEIKPMVKGILSENYYIQGFEDLGVDKQCKMYNSCSQCLKHNECSWNPRSYSCNKRGFNDMWQITQPSKCVLTPTVQRQMILNPHGNV